mmetsp:Transcript_148305/g.259197  ORF Transcript_148305/g.259197 Transcript_148305/m.259197 type:complete len:224 (-) Transcript_148305:230-901(-)
MGALNLQTWEETLMAMFICIITNASMLFFIVAQFRNKNWFEAVLGIATILVSTLYHSAEILGTSILGMNDGQWHRLDNVFAILCLSSLCVFFMCNNSNNDDFFRWGFLVLILWFQERGPWDLENTIIPIVIAFSTLVGKYLWLRRLPPFVRQRPFHIGLVWLLLAVVAFSRGLDDSTDYLRFWHGLWHMFGAVAFHFFWRIDRFGWGFGVNYRREGENKDRWP